MPDTMPIIVTEVTEIRIAKDQPVSVSITNLEDLGKMTRPPFGKFLIKLKYNDGFSGIIAAIDARNFAYQLQNFHGIGYTDSSAALFMVDKYINSSNRQRLSTENEKVLKAFQKGIYTYFAEERKKFITEPKPHYYVSHDPCGREYYLADLKITYTHESISKN